MRNRTVSFLAICGLLLFAVTANGQTSDEDPAIVEARALLQAERKEIISDEIRFSTAEAEAFWPLYDQYRADILEIRDRQAEVVVTFWSAYRSGTVSEQMANDLVDGYLDIKSDLLKVQKKYLPKFRKVLPARKVGRFYQLENKLDAEADIQLARVLPLMDPV